LILGRSQIFEELDPDRAICDLLWFPTGGGKTEAYLGLAAFTLGLRRLRVRRTGRAEGGAGVSVLSRYTLRLLTIQQFRRALGVITACEYLRVTSLTHKLDQPIGWRPLKCHDPTKFLWGTVRFSTGMWVGGNVTPNNLLGFKFPTSSGQFRLVAGAIEILRGVSSYGYEGPDQNLQKDYRGKSVDADGDPAQVLNCPVCNAILAIPEDGLGPGSHTVHFVFSGRLKNARVVLPSSYKSFVTIDFVPPVVDHSNETHTLSITFTVADNRTFSAREVDRWWYDVIYRQIPTVAGSPVLLAARPARPGYFLCTFLNQQRHAEFNNFEIYCPDPHCELNCHDWVEQVPLNVHANHKIAHAAERQTNLWNGKWSRQDVLPFVRKGRDSWYAERIPIPAYTTDDQIYHRCPSLVIATVDKFARLSFEPCLGPLSVALLRQAGQIDGISVSYPWHVERRINGGFYSEAVSMDQHRHNDEVKALPDLFERRSQEQPVGRRPPAEVVRDEAASELDRWHAIASKVVRAGDRVNDRLVYTESAMTRIPERSVVLGDAQHQLRRLPVAFENAPNSLRDVEETTQFKE
jgi:hypothetical protein